MPNFAVDGLLIVHAWPINSALTEAELWRRLSCGGVRRRGVASVARWSHIALSSRGKVLYGKVINPQSTSSRVHSNAGGGHMKPTIYFCSNGR